MPALTGIMDKGRRKIHFHVIQPQPAMTRRIYWITLLATLIASLALYQFRAEIHPKLLLNLLLLLSVSLITCIHGIIAHLIYASRHEALIMYPVLMGVSYTLLFSLFVLFILPMFCMDLHDIF